MEEYETEEKKQKLLLKKKKKKTPFKLRLGKNKALANEQKLHESKLYKLGYVLVFKKK